MTYYFFRGGQMYIWNAVLGIKRANQYYWR